MTTVEFLSNGWQWKPEVLGGSLLGLAGYAVLVRPVTWRAASFAAGVGLLLLSLVSPLDTLAHTYLFSAHMAQHLLMILVVPPLFLLGIPPEFYRRFLAWPPASRMEELLGRPFLGWGLATAVMWVWHHPALYGAALRAEGLHVLQHLLFLATATLFWWPVLAPLPERARLAPWAAILYLFTAMAAGSVLGIILAFAPPGLYPAYLAPDDPYGVRSLIREGWGLSAADDQQFGGFLMWIPGGFVYSLAMFWTLARWFSEPEDDVERGVWSEGARG